MGESFKKVLIIEDDEDLLVMLNSYVAGLGYEVRSVTTATDAWQAVRSWRPAILLLDVHLPGIPGIQFLKEVKGEQPDLPVLLMSADNSEETAIVGLSSGASDFLVKPIRLAELTVKIQNNLDLAEYRAKLKELNKKLAREKALLTRYFSEDLVEKILSEEVSPELGGTIVTASILFVDLRDSTRIAERMEPTVFAAFISTFFTAVMDIVFRERGSVNKLLGDGILATFGCPVPSNEDAMNAVRCAAAIREYIIGWNAAPPDFLSESISIGIGVATGRVFAGNVGSKRRMEYTALGDPVNLAARLQELTKKLECTILADEATCKAAGVEADRRMEQVTIRGRTTPMDVFTLDSTPVPAATAS